MNKLSTQKRAQILSMMVEGMSMRSITRLMQVGKNTIARLLVEAGQACAAYQDEHLRNLPCKRLQVDEMWSFVYAKAKNVPEHKLGEAGDVWVWTAIDADSKLIPCFMIGARGGTQAKMFIDNLAKRLLFRVQLTTDGLKAYLQAVETAFGDNIDYGMLVKIYGELDGVEKRYSPGQYVRSYKEVIRGYPDPQHVSTSFIERQNLNVRMGNRRFTRLTNAFSKKVDNHYYSLAVYFMHYNFVRIHQTLRVTPAMAAEVSEKLWSMEDVVHMVDRWSEKQNELPIPRPTAPWLGRKIVGSAAQP
jgi:IS1 family transposase